MMEMDIITNVRMLAEILTIFVSIAGISIAFRHVIFLNRGNHPLTNKLSNVFLTDAAVYAVTLIMGVALFFDIKWLVVFDIIIRPFILFLNVYASIQLYNHHQMVKKVSDE